MPCNFGAHPRLRPRDIVLLETALYMVPVVSLEPLRFAVLMLAAAVVLLLIIILAERTVAGLRNARSERREAALTDRVCRAVEDHAGRAEQTSCPHRPE